MSSYSVCCDFDGTICIPDACDFLLQKFASPEWKQLDEQVWRGEITEREAFPRQMGLLNVSWDEARDALVAGVKLREGFAEFVEFCRDHEIPLVILSSGLTELIEELLHAHGIFGVRVEAHRLAVEPAGWRVLMRDGKRLEAHCSHCKCVSVLAEQEQGRKVVYIGDSFTDLCPVRFADVIFATYKLAAECDRLNRLYTYYDTFFEIEHALDHLIHSEQDLRR
jgi:2,3-diketo-5-methylthio-1-phosphopentane phosphatase